MTEAELNAIIKGITDLGYKVSDLLNKHIEAGDATDEQLNALRVAASHLTSANSVVWEQYSKVREVSNG
jgi:hypothetical protein